MRRFAFLFVLLLLPMTVSATEILSVTLSADTVPQYEMIEISVELDRDYDNPYDPEQVDLAAVITTPIRDEVRVIGFWYEPYTRSLEGDLEVFTSAGPGEWRVRYAPLTQGTHEFHIVVVDDEGTAISGDFAFTAVEPISAGFVRIDPANTRYFVYDNGDSYVPLGFNIDWVNETAGAYAYIDYLDAMIAGGGNWTRMWLTHFGQGLTPEWGVYHHTGFYEGLGRYSQQIGCKLDAIYRHAQENGAAIAMVLHQHSQFECPQWSSWDANPYNEANGGPCTTSADYFTDPEAQRLSDNLHRYIVARYAAFRSVMTWEIWNEADGISGVQMNLMNPWAQRVAENLRELDPAGHLVSTSFATPLALPTFDLETWDFNNRHQYVFGSWMIGLFLGGYRQAEKPLLLAEFGIDWWAAANEIDTLGVNVHNGIWSTLAHGYAGGAMNWWWDNYIEPYDLWHLNQPAAEFVAGEAMGRFTEDVRVTAQHDRAKLEAAGIGAKNDNGLIEAWLWVRDHRSSWLTPTWMVKPMEGAEAIVEGVVPGTEWVGEAWDTWTGEIVDEVEATADGGALVIVLPIFERDIALKLAALPVTDDDTIDDDTVDDDTVDDDVADDDSADDDDADDDVSDDDNDDLAQNSESDEDSDDQGCGCD